MIDLLVAVAALLAAGAASGFLAGFFGVGGGAPVVFALYETLRILDVPVAIRMHMAIGTALAVMVPTAIVSFRAHRKRGSVDDGIVRTWALPVIIGVGLGSVAAAAASQLVLKIVFATLTAGMAARVVWSRVPAADAIRRPSTLATRIAGLVTGFLSSLMGIGGGVFGNVFLALHGFPMVRAVGTSASLGILIGIPGMLGYMAGGWAVSGLPPGSIGYVSAAAAIVVAPVAAVAAPLGVRAAHGFEPATLRRLFAAFLLVLSARFWISVIAGA